MIDDLSTYSIRDFILFSSEILLGLYQAYNQDIWPVQIVFMIFVLDAFALVLRKIKWSEKIFFVLLASAWFWTGLVFHQKYFVSINWSARYFSWYFVFEGVCIFLFGAVANQLKFDFRKGFPLWIGMICFGFSIFGPVLMNIVWGRNWNEILAFGWGPDQTALGTMGILLLLRGRFLWALLFLLALLWCVFAAILFYGLKMIDFYWLGIPSVLVSLGALLKVARRS